jgi:hypothetical protein
VGIAIEGALYMVAVVVSHPFVVRTIMIAFFIRVGEVTGVFHQVQGRALQAMGQGICLLVADLLYLEPETEGQFSDRSGVENGELTEGSLIRRDLAFYDVPQQPGKLVHWAPVAGLQDVFDLFVEFRIHFFHVVYTS